MNDKDIIVTVSIGYAVPLSAIFLLLTIPFYHNGIQKVYNITL